ncbi:hypothetical protein TTHERM_00497420 (macronuclear) [Tetrahymena thermophila SB210]|uniref:Uncharacterized protein n=1 Tax=Tetrahymena thermophila (strain SB210) TaxID=312017 RepID=I7MN09_TETTS|nr:hypothetical protein TTHERM_00497420 [Tetrahymena thermophila SB210]EAS07689.2 hypothetical protein TTHERM_00497420 [Tetrahymena thermophila SB210]|eukprot:XP_001027931.2 hypothetical protein TTHERM_00497420 [Tetrahymena thermophila SB210]
MQYFSKFEDIHFNQKQNEVIELSLYKMKNNKKQDQKSSQLQKIDKLKLPKEYKIQLLRGLKENLEQKLQEEKASKQRLNVIRKMQLKQERLDLQNSLKKSDSVKENQDLPSSSSSNQSSPKKDNKKVYEEITSLVKALTEVEKDLIKMKQQRNKISEQLEDVKYDLIDMKEFQQIQAQELLRQDLYMNDLKKQITVMSQHGLCTPREYISNLNQTRLNQTRLNATIMEEVKFKLENVKDFLKDAYSKIKRKKNNEDPNQQNQQGQNTNRILSGLDVQ